MKKSLLIIVSLGLVLGLAACDVSLAGDVTPPPGARMPEVQPTQAVVEEAAMPEGINLQAGANWYVEKCLDCHGPQGLGDGNQAGALGVLIPPIGVMEQAYLASPLEWFNVVRDGRMALMMPPFSGSLSDQDIWDVLGYVYGLGTDPALLAEGEAIFGETCAACHGAEGEGGAASGAPSLQDAERTTSLSLAEIAHKIATGSGNEAHAFANQLDNDQQQAAALFVRSFLFGIIDPELVVEEPVDQDSTDAGEAETAVPGEDPAEVEEPISVVPGTGNVVSGNVVNKSGTGISEGLQVSLQGYLNYELVLDLTAPVAEDGSFVIEDVVFEAETIYIAVVEYQDMFYPSDFYMAEGGDEGVVFEVEIYDSTTDTSALEVSRMHIFFEWITPESVQVVHMVTVSNLGTETVFAPGENEPVLEFSIPDQATNLLFETGA
ncbi:MAG: c-type cytochrome, partial [Chloroflexota bacterium]